MARTYQLKDVDIDVYLDGKKLTPGTFKNFAIDGTLTIVRSEPFHITVWLGVPPPLPKAIDYYPGTSASNAVLQLPKGYEVAKSAFEVDEDDP